jgi:hypothetical protein
MASSAAEKQFTFDGEKISFEASISGVTGTIVMVPATEEDVIYIDAQTE